MYVPNKDRINILSDALALAEIVPIQLKTPNNQSFFFSRNQFNHIVGNKSLPTIWLNWFLEEYRQINNI